MGYDLLANPFAVLGLASTANIQSVTARARELSGGDALAASRALISPRSRLDAELGYLPEATQAQVEACLKALRAGAYPDLALLSPLARANVLAHLASAGKAKADQLRSLVSLQQAIPRIAPQAIARGRVESKMPPVPNDMLEDGLRKLESQHAGALVDGIISIQDGARLLSEVIRAAGPEITKEVMFLRLCASGWERAKAGESASGLEAAELLEARLREKPDPKTAGELARFILKFAALTGPLREISRIFGLPHEPLVEAMHKWQAVALDLNNRLDAVPEAVTLLDALATSYGSTDDLGRRIKKNLDICRERLAAGDGTPEMRRLLKAIQTARGAPDEFDREVLNEGRPVYPASALVLELHESFVLAARRITSVAPWSVLRAYTLFLHNEQSSTRAAWSLTRLAILQAQVNVAGAGFLVVLQADQRWLRAAILQRDLEVATSDKQAALMRQLLAELVPLTDDLAQRRSYESALSRLRWRATVQYVKWGFWTTCAAGLLLVMIKQSNTSAPYQPSAPSYRPALAVTAAPEAAQTEVQPVAGAASLSLPELRWCRYQHARTEGAEDYVIATRSDPTHDINRFNAAVDAYNAYIQPSNSSCGAFSYRRSDGNIVDAELTVRKEALRAEGRRVVVTSYLAPLYSSTPSYAAPGLTAQPVPYSPPIAPASKAYSDGQAGRRDWETWFGKLDGGIREGAEWWATVRSTSRPPACAAVETSLDRAAGIAGCSQARIRLGPPDQRRRAEPDYKAGWNNP